MSDARVSSQTARRRSIIRKWIVDEGLTNRNEIQRRLRDEYGINVSRQTIYKDFAKVAHFTPDDLKEFQLDIMGLFKKYIHELEVLIAKEKDSYKKAQLIKMLSQVIKDRHSVAASIAADGEPVAEKKKKEKREDIVISFS